MFYIAICDDDPLERERLEKYLSALRDEGMPVEIKTFSNGYHLASAHKLKPFHLILLDMLMEPITGLETAAIIRKTDPLVYIIFITVTAEYAVKGYSVDALRYILKPVDKDELLRVVKPILKEAIDYSQRSYVFSTIDGAQRIKLADILYFESNLRKISLNTFDGEHEFYGKINEIEKELDTQYFVRTHKSFVVNLRHIKNLQAESLTLENNTILPISRRRYKDILNKFLEMNAEK